MGKGKDMDAQLLELLRLRTFPVAMKLLPEVRDLAERPDYVMDGRFR